jgi:hypothetical protein
VLYVTTLKASLRSWPAASRMGAVMHGSDLVVLLRNMRGDVLFRTTIVDGLLAVQGELVAL